VSEVGIATGLAWTEAGGEILMTETSLLKGKGNLTITGSLGESCGSRHAPRCPT
jgi:ATP-dependent Lon protease